jgi:predicted RNA binding protein YcfA (HicA-like mRNA interferase family)
MGRLPALSGKELAQALEKAGFERKRQVGSHATYEHPDGRQTVVKMTSKTLKAGTQAGIIRRAKLTEEELARLLQRRPN